MHHQKIKKKISRTSRWTVAQSVDMRKDFLDKKSFARTSKSLLKNQKSDELNSETEYQMQDVRKSHNSSLNNLDQKE